MYSMITMILNSSKSVYFLNFRTDQQYKKHKIQKLYTMYDCHAFYHFAYSNITDK